jgi:hypothetical protein
VGEGVGGGGREGPGRAGGPACCAACVGAARNHRAATSLPLPTNAWPLAALPPPKRYTTRIEADAKAYPVLLSNGNLVDQGKAQSGRHFAVWEVSLSVGMGARRRAAATSQCGR